MFVIVFIIIYNSFFSSQYDLTYGPVESVTEINLTESVSRHKTLNNVCVCVCVRERVCVCVCVCVCV